MAPKPTISLRKISKSFTSGESTEEILHSIDLDLYPGECVAFLGPSGSGKSTLLNILGLLSSPDSGSYTFKGIELTNFKTKQLANKRLQDVSFIFQAFHLIDHKSAAANVELPLIYLGLTPQERQEKVAQALEKLGLEHRAEAKVSTLSGGEKQRVAIARAVVTSPTLLLCDEPTGSLDSTRSQEVIKLLKDITANHQTTVIVTHDPAVAVHCDRTISILDGELTIEPYSNKTSEASAQSSTSKLSPQGKWLTIGFKEALDATVHRLRRNIFTMLGVILGVASLVTTVGIAATISAQISSAFNVYLAQHITLTQSDEPYLNAQEALELASSSNYRSLEKLNGVKSVSLIRPLSGESLTVTAAPENRIQTENRQQVQVLSASPNIFTTQDQQLLAGSFYSQVHQGSMVAVASESLLKNLGITWQPGLTLYLENKPLAIIGVVSENPSLADYYGALYLPLGTDLPGHRASATSLAIATEPGAANQISQEAPYAISPALPQKYTAAIPPSPETLKNTIGQSQQSMLLILSAVTLVIGAMGIMNTFLVAVTERQKEIGLRLALGAPPRGILAQFLSETSLISLAGALAGIITGINLIALISFIKHWTPVISPSIISLGIISGLVIGVLAGIYPAWKASRIDPVETLNR